MQQNVNSCSHAHDEHGSIARNEESSGLGVGSKQLRKGGRTGSGREWGDGGVVRALSHGTQACRPIWSHVRYACSPIVWVPHNCISQQMWPPTVTKSLTNPTSLIVLPGVKSAHGAGKCRAARKALHASGGRRGGSARRPTLHYPGSWLAAASASVWRPGGGGESAAQWRGMPGGRSIVDPSHVRPPAQL